ncbi:MAG: hypothetical protein WD894_14530 [Pirellulales bacterium]
MFLRPILVGIVEIDEMAGETFLFEPLPTPRFSVARWREVCAGNTACAVLAADLPRLREDLDSEFRRLQARLAA